MKDTSIVDYYEHDHDRLDALFTQYRQEKRSAFDRAAACLRAFTTGLLRHIDWEEQILFPLFEARTGMARGPTAVMRMEHQQVKAFLAEINARVEARNPDTDEDDGQLLELLKVHNQKEENILYPAIDRLLSPADRQDVFNRMGVED